MVVILIVILIGYCDIGRQGNCSGGIYINAFPKPSQLKNRGRVCKAARHVCKVPYSKPPQASLSLYRQQITAPAPLRLSLAFLSLPCKTKSHPPTII